MEHLIGVDGGGTKTLAILADLEGRVLGRGLSSASNFNAVGFEAACSSITAAIADAREDQPGELVALCLGLAGAGRQEDQDQFRAWVEKTFPKTRIQVTSDAEILLAAFEPYGEAVMGLVCGTGSGVYGRTAGGELLRAGGWGYLFGDEGSSFAIGAAILRAVMHAYDGRGEPTLLTDLTLARRGLKDPQGLIRDIYGAESSRAEIAALASLAEEAARQIDPVALNILDEAALDLAHTVQAVYRKLGNFPLPLAITGSTILSGDRYAACFHRACHQRGMEFTEVRRIDEPAEGAVRLARALISGAGC